MKKRTIFFILYFLTGTISIISATSIPQKIVCVNSSEIIQKMPEFIIAKKQLKSITEKHDFEFQKILNQFQKKSHQYEQEAPFKKSSENKKRSEELFNLRKKAEEYQKLAAENLTKKQDDFLNPIYKKIENAIVKVANQDTSITRVDDCSPGKGILINKGYDITFDVLKELGIK